VEVLDPVPVAAGLLVSLPETLPVTADVTEADGVRDGAHVTLMLEDELSV
jgi:hypothetical protein